MPKNLNSKAFGNVRTVFSVATSSEEKLRAIRDIGYCAISAGLLAAGLTSFGSVEAFLGTWSSSTPIAAAIAGGLWALKA